VRVDSEMGDAQRAIRCGCKTISSNIFSGVGRTGSRCASQGGCGGVGIKCFTVNPQLCCAARIAHSAILSVFDVSHIWCLARGVRRAPLGLFTAGATFYQLGGNNHIKTRSERPRMHSELLGGLSHVGPGHDFAPYLNSLRRLAKPVVHERGEDPSRHHLRVVNPKVDHLGPTIVVSELACEGFRLSCALGYASSRATISQVGLRSASDHEGLVCVGDFHPGSIAVPSTLGKNGEGCAERVPQRATSGARRAPLGGGRNVPKSGAIVPESGTVSCRGALRDMM